MSIFEQIKRDSIQARKVNDPVAKGLLVTLYSEISNINKTAARVGTEITDDDAISVIKKFVKNTEENIIRQKENE